MFGASCLVVAHPDDEILWFSAVISKVDRVIVCFLGNPEFPDRGEARKRVLENHPVPHVECLDLDVPLTRNWADWSNPIEYEYGLLPAPEVRDRYEESFHVLRARLREELTGCRNVFTHNPWGEYGHDMHIQVHRVVRLLADDVGYRTWFSNYVSTRTTAFAERYLRVAEDGPVCLATEIELAHQARALYIAEGCWTGPKNFVWFEQECYNRMPDSEVPGSRQEMFPLNDLDHRS